MHHNKAVSGYDNLDCHIINLLNCYSVMKTYDVSNVGPSAQHLGYDNSKVIDKMEEHWCIGSSTNIKERTIKAEILGMLYNTQGYKIKIKTKK